MSSPAVLDLDALVQPIPGTAPAGGPLADAIRLDLDEFRKEPDPLDPSTANRKPEWGKIIRLTTDALTTKSKDLLVAVRLVEAAAKKDGVPGLRDGLKLLHRLVDECWDRIYPKPDDGEGMEVRGGPFNWINDVSRGAKFPHVVGELALVKPNNVAVSYLDWIQPARKAELEELIPKADPKKVREVYDDLIASRQALRDLAAALDAKMGADIAPDFLSEANPGNLGTVIGKCIEVVEDIAHRRGVPLSDEAKAAGEGASASSDSSAMPQAAGPTGIANNRDGLYRQVQQIADALKVIDRHSPIPYLLERCVKLGALPFPELMRAIIRENTTLDELDRLMGIEKKAE